MLKLQYLLLFKEIKNLYVILTNKNNIYVSIEYIRNENFSFYLSSHVIYSSF